ncbi:MAG: hypothetical protein P4L40_26665 [Terracidiphilus sp.]|nr:hypothetical protein [Terracidiphilus sp.]
MCVCVSGCARREHGICEEITPMNHASPRRPHIVCCVSLQQGVRVCVDERLQTATAAATLPAGAVSGDGRHVLCAIVQRAIHTILR